LRRLDGIPDEVLANQEVLDLVLPALRADTALYRKYVYIPRQPLSCPIFAYGGETDPNVASEHLAAWAEHTTAAARVRRFPGGHFFLQGGSVKAGQRDAPAAFLDALIQDLLALQVEA
jgi:medium-chain acyl-[acyl-carrier-protein] hydrolase